MTAPMRAEKIQAASDLLAALWREGRHIAALPPDLRPQTRAEGYAIQARIEARSAHPLRGWKIAATSLAGQRHINVDGPLAGRLLAENVLPEGEVIRLGPNRMRVAEVEFVFRMGRSLAPRSEPYGQAEVMAAVAALHLGVEVPDSRYTEFVTAGAPQLIADDACADRFVLGAEAPPSWRDRDLAAHRVEGRTAEGLVHEGSGANVLGDPRVALTWLANELSQHGIVLAEGQIVTTGTCVTPIPVGPGDTVTGLYGDLGRIEVRFEA
jgi:2-keto-4-pentenoate hydratase